MSLFAMLAGAAMAAAPRPNFVILFVDDMGIDQIEVPPGQRSCVNFVSSKKEKKETHTPINTKALPLFHPTFTATVTLGITAPLPRQTSNGWLPRASSSRTGNGLIFSDIVCKRTSLLFSFSSFSFQNEDLLNRWTLKVRRGRKLARHVLSLN